MHVNKANDKKYIGYAKDFNSRWSNGGKGYLYRKQNGEYNQPAFASAINKYGWDGFDHIIIADNLTEQEAKNKEIELIALYKSNCCRYNNPKMGYNMTDGGDGTSGYMMDDNRKAKLIQSNMRRSMSENNKKALFEAVAKPVVQLTKTGEFVKEYTAGIIAERETNIERCHIFECCNHKRASAGGFLWILKSEYDPSFKYSYEERKQKIIKKQH